MKKAITIGILFLATFQGVYSQVPAVPESIKPLGRRPSQNNKLTLRTGINVPADTLRKFISFASIATKTEISKAELFKLNISKATIFFTGVGFPSTVSVQVDGRFDATIANFSIANKIVNGTRVVFDPAVFRNVDGSKTQPIKKAFIIIN